MRHGQTHHAARPGLGRAIAWFTPLAAGVMVATFVGCTRGATERSDSTFATPEDAVAALTQAVEADRIDRVAAIFGPGSQALIESSDARTSRQSRQTFLVATAEGWHLDAPDLATRTLVIGHEDWPFPIPIVREGARWRFDAAAGLDEILARRIGRNELSVIGICRTYVAAQRIYARTGHDGGRPGRYARVFRSDAGRENGLYWDAAPGHRSSPLGDLVAAAAADGQRLDRADAGPSPFHGYLFRILTAQGDAAPGGARSHLVDGELTGGFALVAWPATYDVTGVMTFIVGQDGLVHERDLGPDTEATARAMTAYQPDQTWRVVR